MSEYKQQIKAEHARILQQYKQALLMAERFLKAEVEAVDDALVNNTRFNVRHGLLDLAQQINDMRAKMAVFSNFSF